MIVRYLKAIPKPLKARLPVESNPSLERLRGLYPDAEVWQAQEAWNRVYGIYLDTFLSWAIIVVFHVQLVAASVLKKRTGGESESEAANALELLTKSKREDSNLWLFLRMLVLITACDLVVFWIHEIHEQSPHAFWLLEAEKIRKLRSAAVSETMNVLPQKYWLTAGDRSHNLAKQLWDIDPDIRMKTAVLLKALEKLQSAQNDVHDKLRALELILLGSRQASAPNDGET